MVEVRVEHFQTPGTHVADLESLQQGSYPSSASLLVPNEGENN